MAYSLRLPAALDVAARAKADYLGISLNSLLCVALDAYLSHSEKPVDLVSCVKLPAPESVKLTRKEKQALYEKDKLERKRIFAQR